MLRCAMCNRPLLRYAASAKVRVGLIGWGPTCAKAAGYVKQHPRQSASQAERDKRTIDWVRELAA